MYGPGRSRRTRLFRDQLWRAEAGSWQIADGSLTRGRHESDVPGARVTVRRRLPICLRFASSLHRRAVGVAAWSCSPCCLLAPVSKRDQDQLHKYGNSSTTRFVANLSPTEVTRARASCRPRVKLPSAICQLPASARPLYGFITLDFRGSRQRSVREGNDPKYIFILLFGRYTRVVRTHNFKGSLLQEQEPTDA